MNECVGGRLKLSRLGIYVSRIWGKFMIMPTEFVRLYYGENGFW